MEGLASDSEGQMHTEVSGGNQWSRTTHIHSVKERERLKIAAICETGLLEKNH